MMKNSVKHIVLAALLCFLPLGFHAFAQDWNCPKCTINAVLESLPADNGEDFNDLMSKLASVENEAVRTFVSMLDSPEDGQNSIYEYALNGLVVYASSPGREKLASNVKKSLFWYIDECEGGDACKAFLINLTRLLVGPGDVSSLKPYLDDDYLRPYALSVLISIPDIDSKVLSLIKSSKVPDSGLAYLAAAKGISKAEKYLLNWTSSDNKEVLRNVYKALGECGSAKSLGVLAKAAKAEGYGLGSTNAAESYFNLVRRLVMNGDNQGLEELGLLLKSDDVHVRINALEIMMHSDRLSAEMKFLSALQDDDREYRCAALSMANEFASEALYKSIASLFPKLGDSAKADILLWFAERNAVSQSGLAVGIINDLVLSVDGVNTDVSSAASSENAELAVAAIRAAGKLGGDDAMKALIACLPGPFGKEAATALASFNGDIRGDVLMSLYGSPEAQRYALALVGHRHIKESVAKVLELTQSQNEEVRNAAYIALEGVCSAADFENVCDLLDACAEEYVSSVQSAAIVAAKEIEYGRISARMEASQFAARYYPLLADNGGEEAVATLLSIAKGEISPADDSLTTENDQESDSDETSKEGENFAEDSRAAFASLLKVDADIVEELLELAALEEGWKDAALSRACDLIENYITNQNAAGYYVRALELAPSSKVVNKYLTAVEGNGNKAGIGIALPYTDNPATAESAAYAIKAVVSKNPELLSDNAAKAALMKALEVFTALADSSADASYAVDEINGML